MSQRTCKVVFAGYTSVGKTSIVDRIVFSKFSSDITPTLGASFASKEVTRGDTTVAFQLWDTAGQEKYKGMTPLYFRNAHIVMLVFSLTDMNSFEEVDSWIKIVRDTIDTPIQVYLIGNKSDLEDQRVVTNEKAEEKAEEIGAKYMEVSALTGYGLTYIFDTMFEDFMSLENQSVTTKPTTVSVNNGATEKKKCC